MSPLHRYIPNLVTHATKVQKKNCYCTLIDGHGQGSVTRSTRTWRVLDYPSASLAAKKKARSDTQVRSLSPCTTDRVQGAIPTQHRSRPVDWQKHAACFWRSRWSDPPRRGVTSVCTVALRKVAREVSCSDFRHERKKQVRSYSKQIWSVEEWDPFLHSQQSSWHLDSEQKIRSSNNLGLID
jgi:hypothetical protein